MCLNETYGKVWANTRLSDILYPKLSGDGGHGQGLKGCFTVIAFQQ